MSAYTTTALVETYVSAIIPWAFVAFYQVMSKGAWRRDPMGWHIMALTAVDAMIFTQLVVASWWPALAVLWWWWRWTQLAVIAGIPVTTVWRGWFTWRAFHPYRPGRHSRGRRSGPDTYGTATSGDPGPGSRPTQG